VAGFGWSLLLLTVSVLILGDWLAEEAFDDEDEE
jgi:hypothetical protein